jgi:putative nucleotidyltransferase with HDIG domain
MGCDLSILIVDDDEGCRSYLTEALRILGYQPREAEDAGAALRQLAEQLPDLICTDLRMPGMDGYEFAELVHSVAPEVPLVVVSGCTADELATAAVRMGASACLAKPFGLADLASVLPRALKAGHRGVDVAGGRQAAHDGRFLLDSTVLQKASQLSLLTQFAATRWAALPAAGEGGPGGGAGRGPLVGSLVSRMLDTILRALPGQRAALVLTEEVGPQSVLWRGRAELKPPLWRGRAELEPPLGRIADQVRDAGGAPWNGRLDGLPVVAAPLVIQGAIVGLVCVARDAAESPFPWSAAELLQAFSAHTAGALENACLGQQLARAFQETVTALIAALEARHKYTEGHSLRVARYARGAAATFGLLESTCEQVHTAALLHDLGKVGVRDAILDKPGKLTDEEWHAMRLHPSLGARILQPLGFLEEEVRFVRSHHERLDGRGYPDGLTGAEIPLGARIIAVADTFDAMCSVRPYRPAVPARTALGELTRGAGSQFDAEIVQAFCHWFASHPDALPGN